MFVNADIVEISSLLYCNVVYFALGCRLWSRPNAVSGSALNCPHSPTAVSCTFWTLLLWRQITRSTTNRSVYIFTEKKCCQEKIRVGGHMTQSRCLQCLAGCCMFECAPCDGSALCSTLSRPSQILKLCWFFCKFMYKTVVYRLVNGHIKRQNSEYQKKEDITQYYID